MKVNIKKKIGKSIVSIEIEEGKARDALFSAAGFTTIPESCSNCNSEDIELQSNKAEKDGKSYKYVKIRCMKCRATSTMGENLDGVNIFWKRFEVYNPEAKNAEQTATPVKEKENTSEAGGEDLPF